MRTETDAPPFASPPCSVRLVVLELSGEEHRDDYFVNSSLNEDNCDQSKNCMGDVPKLEEPLHACQYGLIKKSPRNVRTKNSKKATAPMRPDT